QIREAALLLFCDPLPAQCARLRLLSDGEWRSLLRWLDTSGLALYFLARTMELQLCEQLPPGVLARLQQNRIDNKERTQGMIDESVAIHLDFQGAHLCYATMKGFSLSPHSVPRPELRSQLDLDFLIAERSAPEARLILERRGYHLHAISGATWEFKTNGIPAKSLKDLYKTRVRCVELHIEASVPGQSSLLARTEQRDFHGIRMPVLSPVDLFLGQALHLYKHVSSDFSRAAHFLEFRRHVLARRHDDAFWRELQITAAKTPSSVLRLGLVALLITRTMGAFAPEELTRWCVQRVPEGAQLWVDLYGPRVVFASFPGNKLYLLLQRELESAGVSAKRKRIQALLPLRLPPPITQASPGDSLLTSFFRWSAQLRFICLRLRFHVVEGLRYARESLLWRRRIARGLRRNSPFISSDR
ncbi:MAG: nucleotidyltransferase family protein, partial [Acidobacteriaceae bacterium]